MAYQDERERDEQSRRERIELDKVKQGQMENIYAEQKANEPPPAPMDKQQKRENFWYHYKGRVIAIVAAVLVVGYFVYDMVTKPQYDTTVVIAANSEAITLYQEQFEQVLERYATDLDGDGEANIGSAVLNIKPEGDPDAKNEFAIANKAALVSVLTTGDHMLMLLDDAAYNHIVNANAEAFEDLSDEFPNNERVKADRYYIAGTKFEKHLKEKEIELPENLSISILNFEKSADKIKETQAENYKYVKSILREIVADKK